MKIVQFSTTISPIATTGLPGVLLFVLRLLWKREHPSGRGRVSPAAGLLHSVHGHLSLQYHHCASSVSMPAVLIRTH